MTAPELDRCLACPCAASCPARVTPDMAACYALRVAAEQED